MHGKLPPLLTTLPLLLMLAVASVGCARYPQDPQHTTTRVKDGVLRVGVVHDPPFVQLHAEQAGPLHVEPEGSETELVRALARAMDARVIWFGGSPDSMLEDLEHYRLEMVVGGLSRESPWRRRVTLAREYHACGAQGLRLPRVMALPPGENAWQLRVERFVRSADGQAILRQACKPPSGKTAPGAAR